MTPGYDLRSHSGYGAAPTREQGPTSHSDQPLGSGGRVVTGLGIRIVDFGRISLANIYTELERFDLAGRHIEFDHNACSSFRKWGVLLLGIRWGVRAYLPMQVFDIVTLFASEKINVIKRPIAAVTGGVKMHI